MRPALEPPVICIITDRRQLGGATPRDACERLLALIRNAAQAGVDLVQIRERDLDDRVLADVVRRAVAETAERKTRIIVNDRVDVALTAGAAGVHLTSMSMAAERVRSRLPESWLVGRSVHGAAEAAQVTASGALDYLIAGTVFETTSKPGCIPIGSDGLAQITQAVDTPVLAVGGITATGAEAVGRAGAAGLAAIRAFINSGARLQGVVENLRGEFDKGRSALL